MKYKKYHIIPALCAAAVFLLLRVFFFAGYVPTESMEPTIRKDSFILGIRIYGTLQAGDIIIFEKNNQALVKRIAASEGEIIQRDGKTIMVPTGSFYVLGDNAGKSLDSRYWEEPFVKQEQILAKVFFLKHSDNLEGMP